MSAGLKRFVSARIARLWPMYMIVITAGCLIFPRERLADALPALSLWPVFLQAVFPNFGNELASIIILPVGHLWSVSVEVILYASFPVIALTLVNASPSLILRFVICAIAFMALTLYTTSTLAPHIVPAGLPEGLFLQWLTYYSPMTHIFEFFLGCAAAAYAFRELRNSNTVAVSSATMFLSLTGTLCLAILEQAAVNGSSELLPREYYFYLSVPIAALTAYFVFSVPFAKGNIPAILSQRLVVYGGELSFSIYLIHPILIYLLRNELGDKPRNIFSCILIIAGISAVSFALSALSYNCVERPGKKIVLAFLRSEFRWQVSLAFALAWAIGASASYWVGDRTFPHHETRLRDLRFLRDAMERYRFDHGRYPITVNRVGSIDFNGYLWNSADRNWLPQLVPMYLTRSPIDPRSSSIRNAQYVLKSDGENYKIISLQPEDCDFTRQHIPDMNDPARNTSTVCQSYGYWTDGAKYW